MNIIDVSVKKTVLKDQDPSTIKKELYSTISEKFPEIVEFRNSSYNSMNEIELILNFSFELKVGKEKLRKLLSELILDDKIDSYSIDKPDY